MTKPPLDNINLFRIRAYLTKPPLDNISLFRIRTYWIKPPLDIIKLFRIRTYWIKPTVSVCCFQHKTVDDSSGENLGSCRDRKSFTGSRRFYYKAVSMFSCVRPL